MCYGYNCLLRNGTIHLAERLLLITVPIKNHRLETVFTFDNVFNIFHSNVFKMFQEAEKSHLQNIFGCVCESTYGVRNALVRE